MRNWMSTLRASAVKVVLATVATVFEEDRVDRSVEGGADHPTRPGRHLRSEADRQISTSLSGFDAKIISMYARGMTVREIQGHLEELYGLGVSPDLISAVTDAGGGRRMAEPATAPRGARQAIQPTGTSKTPQVPAENLHPNLFTCLRHGLTGSNTIHRFG